MTGRHLRRYAFALRLLPVQNAHGQQRRLRVARIGQSFLRPFKAQRLQIVAENFIGLRENLPRRVAMFHKARVPCRLFDCPVREK